MPGGSCESYLTDEGKTWWRNCDLSKALFRADSRKFGEYMREAARRVVANKDSYSKMPVGMMNGGVKEENPKAPLSYLLTPINTDPGTGFGGDKTTDCACILTENFFPNFYPKGTKKIDWKAANWSDIDPATGRYCNGRGWLESNEGCNVIADMHVNGIVNYINSLSEGA